MRATVSFHPVDVEFFDDTIQGLLEGRKVNPESYLAAALRLRRAAYCSMRYVQTLEMLLELYEPPPPISEGRLWDKVRSRLERFDHRPDPLSVLARRLVEPELHLRGRPFLITESSADRVASLVDEYVESSGSEALESLVLEQLIKLDRGFGQGVEPEGHADPGPGASFRNELLKELKGIHDLARAAENQEVFGRPGGTRQPAEQLLVDEMPWRALTLHGRAVPYWVADDVDGLETICKAAGVMPPSMLTPAWRLFGDACDRFPLLRESLQIELKHDRQIGAFVPPEDVPELLEFLSREGSNIIKIATQQDQGPTCALLLRKIRECARYAEKHGLGYLEATGLPPMGPELPEADGCG